MASVKMYNMQGAEVGQFELEPSLFAVGANTALVHEAVVAQTANARSVIAHAKDRSEVRGSGRKPWKQKGTGRARHGSRYSPIWKGGGVTFGPSKIRNFSKKINKRAKQKAFAMVLTDKVKHDRLIVIDDLKVEAGKTKALSAIMKNLPSAGAKTLVVVEAENRGVGTAARNIKGLEVFPANALNLIALLRFNYVVFTKVALDELIQLHKR